jgi:hypothetical protein
MESSGTRPSLLGPRVNCESMELSKTTGRQTA